MHIGVLQKLDEMLLDECHQIIEVPIARKKTVLLLTFSMSDTFSAWCMFEVVYSFLLFKERKSVKTA